MQTSYQLVKRHANSRQMQLQVMWKFLAFLLLLHLTTCMRDAEKTEWNRSAYLVKILTETSDGSRVLGCTGTLITPSLVLTSSKCMENDTGNSVIIYAKNSRYRKRAAASVIISRDFAVLEIPPIKDEMCPRSPAPVRLSRLPVNVSLTSAPWEKIDLNDVVERKCRITGFETTSVSNFSFVHTTMQTHVKVLKDADTLIVDAGSGSPVCWDDMGVPLECDLEGKGWTQVGVLHALMRNLDNRINATLTDCDDITALIFSPLSDDTLPELLSTHTLKLLSATRQCFLRPTMKTSENEEEEERFEE